MKIPKDILKNLTDEEVSKLTKYYGTDFYKPYLIQLKKKYLKLYKFLENL